MTPSLLPLRRAGTSSGGDPHWENGDESLPPASWGAGASAEWTQRLALLRELPENLNFWFQEQSAMGFHLSLDMTD
jgi:hypothetical protein